MTIDERLDRGIEISKMLEAREEENGEKGRIAVVIHKHIQAILKGMKSEDK